MWIRQRTRFRCTHTKDTEKNEAAEFDLFTDVYLIIYVTWDEECMEKETTSKRQPGSDDDDDVDERMRGDAGSSDWMERREKRESCL